MESFNLFQAISKIRGLFAKALKPVLVLGLILFFILPLVTCPLWGQVVQKKQLAQSDYNKWGELLLEKTAANAQWTSFIMSYENKSDTLFVHSTTTKKKYDFPNGKNPIFAGNSYFICQVKNGLQILDLSTGKQNLQTGIIQYAYSEATGQTLLLSKDHTLRILTLKDNSIQTFSDVNTITMSPSQQDILISKTINGKYDIGILNLKNKKIKWIIENSSLIFQNFEWHEKAKAVAFFGTSPQSSHSDESRLYFYNLENQRLFELSDKTQNIFASSHVIDKQMNYPLTISADFKSVFLSLRIKETSQKEMADDTVEILNSRDKWIYPMEQQLGQFEQRPILAVWHPIQDSVLQISSAELPSVLLSGNQQYAVLSNPKSYEPQFEAEEGPRDFYIMDLNTGHKEIFLKKQHAFYLYMLPSPSGKYIAYYRDNNWWTYNIASKKHINITKNINVPFCGSVYGLDADQAFGSVGWSSNDSEIILYDKYDLWSINPDGSSFRRLTRGREKQIKFRISTVSDLDLFQPNYSGFKSKIIDLNKIVILRAEGNDGKTGYYKWTTQSGEKQIMYSNSYLDKMYYADNLDAYIYQEQRFDLPPRLMFKKNNSPSVSFFQSNPQFSKYEWGKSELIRFTNSEGKNLKAILYYPAQYDPSKKYPMIVHIYERQSQDLHVFINPNLYASDGFNPSVLSAMGYFVLCPDIEHEQGTVGKNAVDCTVSATNEIISRNLVDSKKIGLMAHSFGGYESNFIITQTDLFAAAVSGASITDLDSFYLDVDWRNGTSNFFRFQNEQWRMGKTLFEDPQLYDQNSPIRNAFKIKTPLLLWSGKEDWHVNWHQSVEFYMALRRLQKQSTLLLYPKEGHVLMNPKNQINLNLKIIEWFDYYLKNDTPAPWIMQSIK